MEVTGGRVATQQRDGTHWWHLAGVAEPSSATPWRWEGFGTLERLPSGHVILLCRPWAHVPQILTKAVPTCIQCRTLKVHFFFPIQNKLVTKTTACAPSPPLFFKIKIHVLWLPVHYWPCLYGSTRHRCWEHLELSNTAGERSRNRWWVGFGFSVSRGCRVVRRCRTQERVPAWWHLLSAS